MDDGSAFIPADFQVRAESHGVLLLFSAHRTPAYNVAMEAGIGSIQTRGHHDAAHQDRTGEGTRDDIEAARPWDLLGTRSGRREICVTRFRPRGERLFMRRIGTSNRQSGRAEGSLPVLGCSTASRPRSTGWRSAVLSSSKVFIVVPGNELLSRFGIDSPGRSHRKPDGLAILPKGGLMPVRKPVARAIRRGAVLHRLLADPRARHAFTDGGLARLIFLGDSFAAKRPFFFCESVYSVSDFILSPGG
jgi:hypothetical protein